MNVVWTEQAFSRLVAIEDHVAADDPRAAALLVDKIVARTRTLARFPSMGRRIPEIPGSALREVVEGSYRIVYRVVTDTVEVLTVFEGHRLLRPGEVERE